MGIQSWKRGVHTGNTIRVGGTSAQKRCLGNQSVLIKRQVNPPLPMGPFLEQEEAEERKRVRKRNGRTKKVAAYEATRSVEVEELNDLEENVFYSLNKKGRWNLPETIRTEIKYSKCMPKEQPDVRNRRSATHDEGRLDEDLTMVQCHALKRGSNCIAVTSTKLPGDGTVSKTKNYLNANSVLQKKTKFRVRPDKKRKSKSATPQAEKAQEKPTMEVEISSPYPRNSYLQYAENSRNSWPVRKDSKQSSRRDSFHDEIYDKVKVESTCHCNYQCLDAPKSNQADRKDRKDDVQRVKAVAESDNDSYVWFLEEFVQMPSFEFQDDEAEKEKEEEKEEEEEEDDDDDEQENKEQENKEEEDEHWETENVLKKVADNSAEIEDWELLENEVSSEVEEFHEGDHGFLAMLIEDALVRKTARLQITQLGDTRTNRKKDRRRNKTPIEK